MSTADERRSNRGNVLLTAEIDDGSGCIRVRVSNVSAHGALVASNRLRRTEAPIMCRINGLAISGFVAWARDGFAGIEFDKPVSLEDLVPKAPSPCLGVTPDSRKLSLRRPGFRGNQLTNEERELVENWKRD